MTDKFQNQAEQEIGTEEAAALLHLTDSYVRRLCREGVIHARREGVGVRAVWFIKRADLDSYQQQRSHEPPRPGPKIGRRSK